MLNLITIAATKTPGLATSFPPQLVVMIVVFGAMFYLMFRSQKKQAQKRQQMIDNIVKGADVIVAGGIHGTIVAVKDKTFTVQIADKVNIEVTKAGVNGVISDDTQTTK